MQYDYVIVGGGSAGATLAARLSEDPEVTVCLLEAGGDGKGLLVRLPAGVVAMMPGKPVKINNWRLKPCRSPASTGGWAISRAARGWADHRRSMPWSIPGATGGITTHGPNWAVTAGAMTMCCPISARPRTTFAGPTLITAAMGRCM